MEQIYAKCLINFKKKYIIPKINFKDSKEWEESIDKMLIDLRNIISDIEWIDIKIYGSVAIDMKVKFELSDKVENILDTLTKNKNKEWTSNVVNNIMTGLELSLEALYHANVLEKFDHDDLKKYIFGMVSGYLDKELEDMPKFENESI